MPWLHLLKGCFWANESQHSQASSEVATLASLPLDVIELICRPLSLRERMALTSCCAALWSRPDVLGCPALWSPLSIGKWDVASERRQRSAAAWLERRAAGLGRLRLHANLPWCHLEGLWVPRAKEPRIEAGVRPLLRLLPSCAPPAAGAGAGSSSGGGLASLELRELGLRRLPPQLSLLTSLLDLSLRGNGALGRAGGSEGADWAPLQALVRLTRLDLRFCGLRALPPQLSALSALAELDASVNRGLGEAGGQGGASTAPLAHLTNLTKLDLSECGLACPPPQLAALSGLADLCLSLEPPAGDAASGTALLLQPLRRLKALTRLQLSSCGADTTAVRAVVGPRVRLTCW